jgi:hypothetical protein
MSYRAFVLFAAMSVASVPAFGQTTTEPRKPRRHFVSVSTDWLNTLPLHFGDHPVADLVGQPVTEAQFESHDYRTRDGAIDIDVIEFKRRGRGMGLTVFPFGASSGATLGLRVSVEDLPRIQIEFAGAGAPGPYALIGARAYDFGASVFVADRSPGWGLGSHAFVGGGFGRIKGDDVRLGDRVFAEGGGGVTSGPIGVELSVKFGWNRLTVPIEHRMLTVPITLRATLTF